MISAIISRVVILLFGTLYPAYASYKAVRTKNLKEYVKWMMYWIVFALFTCAETFTDLFLSFWFPFYYELKIIIVIWLLSPATKGSSILYRHFVHPALTSREQEIDEYISKAREQGYHTMLQMGSRGINYATSVIMQTAIKAIQLPADQKPVTWRGDEPDFFNEPILQKPADVPEYMSDDDEEETTRSCTPPPPSEPTPAAPSSPAQNTRSRRTRTRKVK